MNKHYDIVIVGGGPAGLTAAVYATRRKLTTLVLAKALGGQAALASEVGNWPGAEKISGFDLMDSIYKQTKKLGTEFDFNEVISIKAEGDDFKIVTNKDEYLAKAVILAFGLTPKDLGIPGEEQLKGRGVAYCATCDAPLYKNKKVAIVGGGNSALEAAEYLSKLASQVYLINDKDKFFGENLLLEKLKNIANIELICGGKVLEIVGQKKVTGIKLAVTGDQQREIEIDGVFVEVGHVAKTDWLKDSVDLNKRGEIVINRLMETSQPGIFAAGDCTDNAFKQIVIATGDGAKAALQAYKFITTKSGIAARPDWGKC